MSYNMLYYLNKNIGSVAEWLKAPVLKTGKGQPFVSSNLTTSAEIKNTNLVFFIFLDV